MPPFLTQRWDKMPISIKTSVHGSSTYAGCAFDKTSFAEWSASSFPVVSLWLGIQQNVMNLLLDSISRHVCNTLLTRGFLLSWLSMAYYQKILLSCLLMTYYHKIFNGILSQNITLLAFKDILSENITERSTEGTSTYFKALQIAYTSAVKILQPSPSL